MKVFILLLAIPLLTGCAVGAFTSPDGAILRYGRFGNTHIENVSISATETEKSFSLGSAKSQRDKELYENIAKIWPLLEAMLKGGAI